MAIAIRGTTPATASGGGDPTSLTLTGARQPVTNDVLCIVFGNDFYLAANIPTATVAGSTTGVIDAASADGGLNGAHVKAWYYVVTATGDLTIEVNETGVADEEKFLGVYVLSGVDTASPLDPAAGAGATGFSTSHDAPSLSPLTASAFMVCHTNNGGGASSGTYTPPTDMTEQYDFTVLGAMSTSGATQQLTASGATGIKSFTSGNVSWAAVSIAFRTASVIAATRPPVIVAPSRAASTAGAW